MFLLKSVLLVLLVIVQQSVCNVVNETLTTSASIDLQTEDGVILVTPKTIQVTDSKEQDNGTLKIETSQSRNYPNVKTANPINATKPVHTGPKEQSRDFKPSPHWETYYEFGGGFPIVPPAFSEPKLFGPNTKVPILAASSPGSSAPEIITFQQTSYGNANHADAGWNTKIRFPQTHPVTVSDHPYPYMKEKDKVTMGKYPVMEKHYNSYGNVYWGSDYANGKPSKTYFEDEHPHEVTVSPWKKIIKVLTAFIPIGLLISALTPSIITIGPANTTTVTRARMNDNKSSSILRNFSLEGCDDRIFCELLLSAQENNQSDSTVENMLDNYMKKYGDATKLKFIYKAIKTGNCSSLHCNTMKQKPNGKT